MTKTSTNNRNILVASIIIVVVVASIIVGIYVYYNGLHNDTFLNPTPTPTIAPTPTPNLTARPTSTPSPTPTANPVATVTANLNLKVVDLNPGNGNWVILINGTVTDDSPNTAYGVGLHVFAPADGALAPFEETVDVTVPIVSGTYNWNTTYGLSTLTPNQSVTIYIEIIPPAKLAELSVINNATVTMVWSNMPT